MNIRNSLLVVGLTLLSASPAFAQRFAFERSLPATETIELDISTLRGRIEVTAGDSSHVVVQGTATVRIGWRVPGDAVERAKQVANQPPIETRGTTIVLRPPSDPITRDAVTVAYQVRVPAHASVRTVTDSGATTIAQINGVVSVRTQSAAITLNELGSDTQVVTGSGAVSVRGVGGRLRVETQSGALALADLHGGLHARTGSGSLNASFNGAGAVDVVTASSAIRLRDVDGDLLASTSSGHITVSGAPRSKWNVTSGSGGIDLTLTPASSTLNLDTRSGSIDLNGATVSGTVEKRQVRGDIAGGGPMVRVSSRSGSIELTGLR